MLNVCNDLRGLNRHQRSFRAITSLESETFEIEEQTDIDNGQINNTVDWNSLPSIKVQALNYPRMLHNGKQLTRTSLVQCLFLE